MFSGPDARANEVEALTEGVKLTILDKSDSWYKVNLINKEEGWVPMEKAERI